jgi:hypothetical protein
MIQLKVLSGKMAGASVVARRFPLRVGRSPQSDLVVAEPGVWDAHFELDLQPDGAVRLKTLDKTDVTIAGQRTTCCELHNGDVIEAGAARIQFLLAEARSRSLGLRETLTWLGLVALTLGQVLLVYLLLR